MSFYPIALAVAIACFSTYPLLFKKYVNNANLFGLILILVLFTAVGAALPSVVFLFSASISYLSWLTMIAIGLLNSAAFYLVFYAFSRERAGIVNTAVYSQDPLLALFSAIFFFPALFAHTAIAVVLLFIGLALISIDLIALFKKKTLVSKYVWVAFAGTLMWTGFWLLFYTLPRNTLPLVYISFIFLITASIVLAVHYLVFHNKKVKVFAGNPLFKYIAIAGVLDGVGNAAVSFAYTSNPVLTPLSLAAVAPIVILLSFVFLRERFNKREIIGLVLIVAALVFALL